MCDHSHRGHFCCKPLWGVLLACRLVHLASLFGRVTCMSWSAFDVVGPRQALADSLHEHRNEILRLDCRIYPSTSMKSGLSTKELFKNHVPIRAIMEGQIVALKKRLLQTELEADFDKTELENWRCSDPIVAGTCTMRSGAKMCASRSASWLPTRDSHMGRTPSPSPLDL